MIRYLSLFYLLYLPTNKKSLKFFYIVYNYKNDHNLWTYCEKCSFKHFCTEEEITRSYNLVCLITKLLTPAVVL